MKNGCLKVLQLSITLLLLAVGTELYAQDPQFSQFYANSLYLNPGFTGNTTQLRMATTYRNQWPSIPQSFQSYTAAIDYNIESANSGLGLLVVHDKAGVGGLRFTNLNLSYANFIQVSRRLAFRPGIRVGYTQRDLNPSDYTFADQIARDNAPSSVETFQEGTDYIDFSTGVVVAHIEKYWAGIAFDHINQPNYSLLGNEAELPIKMSIHGGWNFEVNGPKTYSTNYLRVIAHYKSQLNWDQFDLGAYYEQEPLVVGFWYRGLPGLKKNDFDIPNHDALVVLIGMNTNDLRIGYSYDITVSRLLSDSGGAHEISLIYEIASRRKKRRRKRFMVPCAKF